MREILFRGKRTDNGEWVEEKNILITDDGRAFIVQGGSEITVRRVRASSIYEFTSFSFEVVPETVGQYTGLTDKNGKKIFEGDILKDIKINELYFVECYTTAFGFDVRCSGDDEYITFFDVGLNDSDTQVIGATIIGNIHDNPELLEVG